jgi:hypothetical protein
MQWLIKVLVNATNSKTTAREGERKRFDRGYWYFDVRSERSGGLPETHSSLIGEGHGAVQAVLAPKHPVSVKNLHRRVSHPPSEKDLQ